MDIKKEFLEELQKMGNHKELPTIKDTVRVGTAIKAFTNIVNRLEARVKPACELCKDKKGFIYHISQDWTESVDCPKCNGGSQKDYDRLEKMLHDSFYD